MHNFLMVNDPNIMVIPSNVNCEMDLRKSVFLEPTENDYQLQPRAPNCKVSLSHKKYNHEHAVECLTRLDF